MSAPSSAGRVLIRRAVPADAAAVAAILAALVAAGIRRRRADADFARHHYIDHPDQIRCSLAVDAAGVALGFQSLKRAGPDNRYGTVIGWGLIGTHVDPAAHRLGIGRRLFAATRAAALRAGLPAIDAPIAAGNARGLAYYRAMGFRDYARSDGLIRTRLWLT